MGTGVFPLIMTKEVLLVGTIGFLHRGDKRYKVFSHGQYINEVSSDHTPTSLITNINLQRIIHDNILYNIIIK